MSGPFPEPMAVEAPTLESSDVALASHVPELAKNDNADSDDDVPLARTNSGANGAKRAPVDSSGSEDDKPLVSFRDPLRGWGYS
jgi:hypothetical protein